MTSSQAAEEEKEQHKNGAGLVGCWQANFGLSSVEGGRKVRLCPQALFIHLL